MTQNRIFASRFSLLTLALLTAPAVSHAQYQAFDLGVLPGGIGSKAFAINNNGYITGYAYTSTSANPHAFLLNGNVAIPSLSSAADLGTTGGNASDGYGINNNNVVVGNTVSVVNATSPLRGAYFNPTAHDVGVSAGTSGALYGVNDNGFAVGASNTGATAVSYQIGSGATSLTSLASIFPAGTTISTAYGVNSSGTITGYYGTGFGTSATASNQAFTYNAATGLKSLGTLGGFGASGDPNGGKYTINASGQIAGFAKTAANNLNAFFYNGTTMIGLGTLPGGLISEGEGLNDQGDEVGNSATGTGLPNHAFLSHNGGALIDLNTQITGTDPFTNLITAYGINDSGWIVGQGTTTGGQTHAYLLKPIAASSVPEPSAVLALGMGLFGAGLALRRRRK